jgi:hypothetical protein
MSIEIEPSRLDVNLAWSIHRVQGSFWGQHFNKVPGTDVVDNASEAPPSTVGVHVMFTMFFVFLY